jgi:hypothetical protein
MHGEKIKIVINELSKVKDIDSGFFFLKTEVTYSRRKEVLYSGKTITKAGYSGKHQQKCIAREIKLQKNVLREMRQQKHITWKIQ